MSECRETIRLYDRDAYAVAFTAEVLSCEEVKTKKAVRYAVVMDQTLFFPEEGGQSPDQGTIDGIEVVDVQIKKGIITHFLKEPLRPGTVVSGKIDWKHRFNNMQQHSGEHLFSGLVHSRFGYDNVGFHLSDQIVTMDFNGVMTAEEIADIEYAVNQAIASDFESKISFPSKEELADLVYRSKIEIEGQVRIVEFPGYDICACCAPHVRRTGEIGMLKVMSVSNYKGGVRISILCGFRALEAFRNKAAVITDLMNLLTTGQDQLVGQVAKMKSANSALSAELSAAKQVLLEHKLAGIPEEQEHVILFDQGLDAAIVRRVVNRLMEKHEGFCGIFNGNEESGYSFVLGSANRDCQKVAACMRQELAARGGGSADMIQGSVKASKEAVLALLENLY